MIRSLKNVLVSALFGMVLLSMTATPVPGQKPEYKETVIAGGPDKFAEVRHVVLKGSNFEIGKKIGELATRYGL